MIQCPQCEKKVNVDGKSIRDNSALQAHIRAAHGDGFGAKKEPETKAKESEISLTPEQQAIAQRISGAEREEDFGVIREDELNDFSLSKNPFDLPPEAQKLQDEKVFAFRFCERTPDRVDFLTKSIAPPLRWRLVNKVTLPQLSHLVDPMIGGVIVMDQILLYKPWGWHEKVKAAKQELAENKDRSGTLEGKAQQIENSVENVEVFTGKQHRIQGSDEVVASEEAYSDLMA